MLLLLFQIRENHFALDATQVVEVAPLLNFKPIPHAPDYVAGKINYRGKAVPVIDLCFLRAGVAAAERLSTRIILINYPGEGRKENLLGLVAEHVTATIRPPPDFIRPSVSPTGGACFLETLGQEPNELIEWFDPRQELPKQIVEHLFRD